MMSELFQREALMPGDAMSSAGGSLARTLASQESGQESTASSQGFGQSSPASFAFYDPVSSSWKMSRPFLFADLDGFSETWPRAGMTRSGIAFRQPPLVPHISETGYSYWPTPNTDGYRSDGELRMLQRKVSDPREFVGMSHRACRSKRKRWWPTPSATDWKGIYNPKTVSRRASESTRGVRLPEQVSRDEGNSGELNPSWVEWLMGFPLGWTDSEDSATPSCLKSPNSSDAA
jgi:hypothetical protein